MLINWTTRMSANAQRDGRTAEYMCRPLFNATKFGWCPLVECRAVRLPTRNPLKFSGVPQTPEPISAVSGPKFTILRGHVEVVLLLNKFFSDCRCLSCEDTGTAQQSCVMVPRWRFFCVIFACCIPSELCAAHFRPASEIRTKATPCVEVW